MAIGTPQSGEAVSRGLQVLFCGRGLSERLFRTHYEIGMEQRVAGFDAGEYGLRQLAGTNLPPAEELRGFGDRKLREVHKQSLWGDGSRGCLRRRVPVTR